MANMTPILEARDVGKQFGNVSAIRNVSLSLSPGEVFCLLGDNGAGKSTLIKVLSGVHNPTSGSLFIDGKPVQFKSPRDALDSGIATVHQHIGALPLMNVARNFFLGAELTKGWGPFRVFDEERANAIALKEVAALGLSRVNDGKQLVGTLSGGERQCIAIARAMYFGARVLILDEPTAALGVKEAGLVLRLIARARDRGVGVILITHNAHHALTIGDQFSVLIQGALAANWRRGEKTREEVLNLMAGGEELEELSLELAKSF
jgi:simple sugar transport system ATP-binding protein